MPQRRHLTRLGRQLQIVLADLRPSPNSSSLPSRSQYSYQAEQPLKLGRDESESPHWKDSRHLSSLSTHLQHGGQHDETKLLGKTISIPKDSAAKGSVRRVGRNDHIKQATKAVGHDQHVQTISRRTKPIAIFADHSRIDWRGPYSKRENKLKKERSVKKQNGQSYSRRKEADEGHTSHGGVPPLDQSIRRIIALAIRRKRNGTKSPVLAADNVETLNARGFSPDDLDDWIYVLTERNARSAVDLLVGRAGRFGVHRNPIFVFTHFLNREHMDGEALRLALRYTGMLTKWASDDPVRAKQYAHTLAVIAFRLTHHARNLWPQALPAIADLTLQYFILADKHKCVEDPAVLRRRTAFLNQLLVHMSLPATETAFKNLHHQHNAIVRILSFMSDHQPSLSIDRDGYRAVIRLQLAQRKTESEQEWADLKALSWPPWKHDRTGIDSLIGPEAGISRAGETLIRARNAGYASLNWEQVASIYAGWDTDWTPTIQTRTILGDLRLTRPNDRIWAARITTTRTIQEAWACYLAWVDAKLDPDQDVYLAIFRKLRLESARAEEKDSHELARHEPANPPAWPLYAGDSLEVLAAPASTHLHTYTRTQPPTVNQLYDQLHAQGIHFKGDTLAFLIAEADTVERGIQIMEHALSRNSEIKYLLTFGVSGQMTIASQKIFSAWITLLSRFPAVRVHRVTTNKRYPSDYKQYHPFSINERFMLDRGTCIAAAIFMLRKQHTSYRRPWEALLRSVSHTGYHRSLSGVTLHRTNRLKVAPTSFSLDKWEIADKNKVGAIVAFWLMHRILEMMNESKVQLDATMFLWRCRTTENMARAAGALLQKQGTFSSPDFTTGQILADCMKLLDPSTSKDLRQSFDCLVGEETSVNTRSALQMQTNSVPIDLPRLTNVPHPAMLHSYVRSLGFLADHENILLFVQWLKRFQPEVLERQSFDRSGSGMMRKTMVAIRVFLERSWLLFQETTPAQAKVDSCLPPHMQTTISRLQAPAESKILDEARSIVEGFQEWGGWPYDHEVEMYCRVMHGQREPLGRSSTTSIGR